MVLCLFGGLVVVAVWTRPADPKSRSCRASAASALEAALVGESMAVGGAPSVALQRVLAALGDLRAEGEVRVAALAEALGDELAALGLAAELMRRGAELRS